MVKGTKPDAQLIDPPRFYTTSQVCEILACERTYIHRTLIPAGHLTKIRRGKRNIVFFSGQVHKLVLKQAKEAGAM
tara:strand:+ start:181 stop:408 length:228 start_codon:yes stop_codon:yes gene_type:complete